jgi:hypothetical protein
MLGGALGIANLIMAVLTLVEQGVVTATRAKSIISQGRDEDWDEARWETELTDLAEKSDSLYSDTQEMLKNLRQPT